MCFKKNWYMKLSLIISWTIISASLRLTFIPSSLITSIILKFCFKKVAEETIEKQKLNHDKKTKYDEKTNNGLQNTT